MSSFLNVELSCHVDNFTIEVLPHEQQMVHTPSPPIRRHNHQTDSPAVKCNKNSDSFVTDSHLEHETCDKPDSIQISSIGCDQENTSDRNALQSLNDDNVHENDAFDTIDGLSSFVHEQHSDSNSLVNDNTEKENYFKLNQNSFER